MEGQYSVYSKFDIEKHKATFTHYLEVVIDADGTVAYAVPSHQEYLIELACKKHGMSRRELLDACPREYYLDFMNWLLKMSGAMAVWDRHCFYAEPTVKQIGMLRRLKMAGLYTGALPHTSERDGEK